MSRRLVALFAVALLAVGAIGCGGGDDGDDKPRAEDVPAGAVAVVGETEVPRKAFDRQVAMLKRTQRRANGGKRLDAAQREQLASQALAQLLQREAIEQEAADRGIEVDDAEVRRTWNATAKRQFKTKKALRQFLGGQSVADVVAQLRLQVLSERIAGQVSEEAGGGKAGKKAAEEFQKEFQKRWQDRTACAKGYTAVSCPDDSKK